MSDSLDQEIRTLQAIFWSERDPEGLAFASLADAFRRKGEVREALDLLTDGMSRHPDYATGHVVATRLYLDQGMSSEAEISARRVLELDAENLVALSAMTSVLAEKGELGEAARHRTLLMSVDPESEEARAVTDLDFATGGDELSLAGEPSVEERSKPDEEEVAAAMDTLGLTAEAPADEPLAAPEAEVAELESELPGPEVELPDLEAITADEPIDEVGEATDFGGEAPAPDETGAEEIVELADLAPDGEEVMALAPDEGEEDEVVDLADLAPDDVEDDDEVVELAALAPDEPGTDDVVDLAALAPDEAEEDEVVDLADLAPDEAEEDEVVDLADLAPDLADLAPDEAGVDDALDVGTLAPDDESAAPGEGPSADDPTSEDDDEVSEPIYTRTLADLYIKQGFTEKALQVLEVLYAMNPHATDLAERIEALKKGELEDVSFPSPPATPPTASSGDGHSEEEVEIRARELAEQGLADSDEVDTPFAWGESDETSAESADDDDAAEPAAGSYFDRLLGWEDRAES